MSDCLIIGLAIAGDKEAVQILCKALTAEGWPRPSVLRYLGEYVDLLVGQPDLIRIFYEKLATAVPVSAELPREIDYREASTDEELAVVRLYGGARSLAKFLAIAPTENADQLMDKKDVERILGVAKARLNGSAGGTSPQPTK